MLAAALLVAGLFGAPRPVHSAMAVGTCPSSPAASFTATARRCPAVEISGRADPSGPSLDPAFDVEIEPALLARPVEGGALLSAYGTDGRKIFALPVSANGPFHVYVPLATSAMDTIVRITLVNGNSFVERTPTMVSEQTAELISTDDDRVIVAWNAHAFPAIRIKEAPDRAPVGTGNGTSTFEQLLVNTRARTLFVEFSNGVRSFTRTFKIFGR